MGKDAPFQELMSIPYVDFPNPSAHYQGAKQIIINTFHRLLALSVFA